jgi:hypothetical protein
MDKLLKEERFGFVSAENKIFIREFTKQMESFGYGFGGNIGSGYCWGKYMVIYSQNGVKSKRVIARIFIRNDDVIIFGGREIKYSNSIVLRLFFSNIDKHESYIENSPSYIKKPFIDEHGMCGHCKDDCPKYRKTYTIDGKMIEKCAGVVFEFHDPKIEYIKDYVDILKEFYGKKSSKK